MKSKKILFISKSFPIFGGVETWLENITVGLINKGYDVSLALAKGANFHNPADYLKHYPKLNNIPWLEIDGRTGITEGRLNSLKKLIKTQAPDIIIPVMLHEALGAASARRAAGQQFKILYPLHELGIWLFHAIKEYQDQIDALASVNKLPLNYCIEKLELSGSRTFHTPLGVEPPYIQRTSQLSSKKIHIGYCGKLTDNQKRVSDVIDFCYQLNHLQQNYMVSIAGSGENEKFLRKHLHIEISNGKVCFLGQLTKNQLYKEFYPSIDVLFIASKSETGPLVAWEAMRHGVLILTSAYTGLKSENIFKHQKNSLIFPVGQPKRAANLLAETIKKPEIFFNLANNGQKIANEMFSLDRMIDRWEAVIEATLVLPPQKARLRNHYSQMPSIFGHIEHFIRKIISRPVYHANAHQEWPRFFPGHVSSLENEAFQAELDKFENQLK